MEPISPDIPFHTKYFDVIVLPGPPLPTDDRATPTPKVLQSQDQGYGISQTKTFNVPVNANVPPPPVFNTNSIMFYEDAILDAIKDLKDGHGSTLPTIKKHIQATFFPQQELEDDDMKRNDGNTSTNSKSNHHHHHHHHRRHIHMHNPNRPFHWYYPDPLHPPSPIAPTSSNMPPVWRENLFLQALKSVLDKKCVVGADLYAYQYAHNEPSQPQLQPRPKPTRRYSHSDCSSVVRNGSTYYKLSQEYKVKHARELAYRMENLRRYKLAQDAKLRKLAMERRERNMAHVPPAPLKPIFRKRDLVPPQAVTIVDNSGNGTNVSNVDVNNVGVVNTCTPGSSQHSSSSTSITSNREGNNNYVYFMNHNNSYNMNHPFEDGEGRRKRSTHSRMEVVRELQKDKRSALPHHPLHLHADDVAAGFEFMRRGNGDISGGSTSDPDVSRTTSSSTNHHGTSSPSSSCTSSTKNMNHKRHPVGLRDKLKIPRHKILVKDIISKSRTLSI